MDTFSRNISFKSYLPKMEQRQLFGLAIAAISDAWLSRLTDRFFTNYSRMTGKKFHQIFVFLDSIYQKMFQTRNLQNDLQTKCEIFFQLNPFVGLALKGLMETVAF